MNIIVFIFLLLPIVYQAIFGFRANNHQAIVKQGLQSAGMEVLGVAIVYTVLHWAGDDFKTMVLYTGITFLLSIGLLVLIQNILLYLRNNQS